MGDVFDDGAGNSCILLTLPEHDYVELGTLTIGDREETFRQMFVSYYYLDCCGEVQFYFKAAG